VPDDTFGDTSVYTYRKYVTVKLPLLLARLTDSGLTASERYHAPLSASAWRMRVITTSGVLKSSRQVKWITL
jgi:hypothetical protein